MSKSERWPITPQNRHSARMCQRPQPQTPWHLSPFKSPRTRRGVMSHSLFNGYGVWFSRSSGDEQQWWLHTQMGEMVNFVLVFILLQCMHAWWWWGKYRLPKNHTGILGRLSQRHADHSFVQILQVRPQISQSHQELPQQQNHTFLGNPLFWQRANLRLGHMETIGTCYILLPAKTIYCPVQVVPSLISSEKIHHSPQFLIYEKIFSSDQVNYFFFLDIRYMKKKSLYFCRL